MGTKVQKVVEAFEIRTLEGDPKGHILLEDGEEVARYGDRRDVEGHAGCLERTNAATLFLIKKFKAAWAERQRLDCGRRSQTESARPPANRPGEPGGSDPRRARSNRKVMKGGASP